MRNLPFMKPQHDGSRSTSEQMREWEETRTSVESVTASGFEENDGLEVAMAMAKNEISK